ncbi:MAG: glycoside hydrolase domain-containing protein [Candidatus Zipacnadales bacterium]
MSLFRLLAFMAPGLLPVTQTEVPPYQLAVPRLAQIPILDGHLAEHEWQGAVSVFGFRALRGGRLSHPQPFVLLGRDETALCLAARLPLPVGKKPKARVTAHDGPVWEDDAIELFIAPPGMRDRYYQFIVNAAGVKWESIGQEASYSADWQAQTQLAQDAWSIEMRIPLTSVGMSDFASSEPWGLNVGWDRQTPAPGIFTWAPVKSSFHEPQSFWKVVFVDSACPFTVTEVSNPQSGTLAIAGTCDTSADCPSHALLRVVRGGEEVSSATADIPPGQVRPFRLAVSLPQEKGGAVPGDYEAYFLLTLPNRVPSVSAALSIPFTVRPKLEVTLHPYTLREGRLVVQVAAPELLETVGQVRGQLISAAGETVAEQTGALSGEKPAEITFAIADCAPGDYTVRVTVTDGQGGTPLESVTPWRLPDKPAWLGSQEGLSDKVLPPWTPIKVQGRTVKVWGRTYEFEGLPLPSAVTTAGASLLAGPIRFVAGANGVAQEWRGHKTVVTERKPTAVTLTTTAESENLRLSAQVRTEYDGMIRSHLTLEPRREVTLDSLELCIPFKPEHAKYLYHYPGRWGSAYNAGALPREGFTSAFRPFIWLGDEDRGLAWFSESDRNFFPVGAQEVVSITQEGQQVVLRIRIIGQPLQLTEPLHYTFGMQATPVKPMVPDVWDYRICHHGNYGLEQPTVTASVPLIYAAPGNINLTQGTFEAWVRPHFNPDPPVARDDPQRGKYNRSLFDVTFPGDARIGFYWNIDDRSMRAYYKRGADYPLLLTTSSRWQEGEWHHVALSWGEETAIYLDGERAAVRVYQGTLDSPLEGATIQFGLGTCEFDIDEVRISAIPRTTFDLSQPLTADEHTLLLDHLDDVFEPNGHRTTTPVKGTPGTPSVGSRFVEGRFGHALALYEAGPPKSGVDRLAELGVRTICFHEHWTDIQNYTSTTHGEELKALVAACHAKGIKLLLYFGYEISNIAPEWPLHSEECLVYPRAGGYKRQPEQTAYIVCYNSPWQDFLVDGIAKMIDEYDIDGVYLDGTANPWGCANLHHGCGYERPDGTIGPTYTFFATREVMRRIYTVVKSRKPEGLVNVHQSTCMTIPTLAWATSYWDGEQFGGIEPGPWALEVLPLDAFRCEFMGRNWGVPAELLCYNRPYTYRQAMSFALLHDVLVRGSLGGSLELEAQLWQAMDDFGRKQARFIPYWEGNGGCATTPRSVKVSAYSRGERGVMLVVSNLDRETVQVHLQLDRERLGLPIGRPLTAWNVVEKTSQAVEEDTLAFPLDSLDFKVLRLSISR